MLRSVLKITSPGWASLVALQVTFSGAMLVAIGLVGDYIARIYEESKHRPLSILVRAVNASPATNPERAIVLPLRRSSSIPKRKRSWVTPWCIDMRSEFDRFALEGYSELLRDPIREHFTRDHVSSSSEN